MEEKIIFLDLDGVLCDFDQGLRTLSYKAFGEPLEFKDLEFKIGRDKIWQLIDDAGSAFWENLVPLKDMYILKKFVFDNFLNIKVLSSSGKSIHAEHGKRAWLKKHNFKLNDSDIFIVPGAEHKKSYADGNSILIDDMDKNIQDWQDAGGIPIKHVNAFKTIKTLLPFV